MGKGVINTSEACNFPNGYTLSDNRIEDFLQRLLSPSAYVVWRQYLRYWGGDKSTAYPSLALVSSKTGLSEKTIRKCNRELCDKGYMKYTQGCSNRSNQYHYISIDSLMEKYYGAVDEEQGIEPEPIVQSEDKKSANMSQLKKLNKSDYTIAKSFIEEYKFRYKEKFGVAYSVEKSDLKEIEKCISEIKEQFTIYTMLLQRYFNTSNEFIQSSDYSILFFLQSKTKKTLISECNKTDTGRWIASAEKELEKLKEKQIDKSNLDEFIKENVKLSGANSERDQFIIDYIKDSILVKI